MGSTDKEGYQLDARFNAKEKIGNVISLYSIKTKFIVIEEICI